MYMPKHFKGESESGAIAFMLRYNFATLVCNGHQIPQATHLPFVVEQSETSILLTSHLAKANPQWKQFANQEALVIFAEPHAYISPTHYDKKQNVPTWNYVAVHAIGSVKIIDEKAALIELMEKSIEHFEARYKTQWHQLSDRYKSNLLAEVVGLEILVTDLEFKEKLSQNKRQTEQQKIIQSLTESDLSTENAIGNYMRDKLK